MAKFVNLTPHIINVIGHGGNKVVEIPPSGDVARVSVEYTQQGDLGAKVVGVGTTLVPIYRAVYGEIEGLPPEPPSLKIDVYYIVSGLVASAVSRADVLSPGELVRDADGRPVGCRGLKSSIK